MRSRQVVIGLDNANIFLIYPRHVFGYISACFGWSLYKHDWGDDVLNSIFYTNQSCNLIKISLNLFFGFHWGMSPWWSLLELLFWFPDIKPSLSLCLKIGHPIFSQWVAETELNIGPQDSCPCNIHGHYWLGRHGQLKIIQPLFNQWIGAKPMTIDLLHKSHNAPVPYGTMYRFGTIIFTCVHMHYNDVKMSTMASQITSRLFTQPFIQAQIKENTKAPRHWPLWGEFTGDQWIPHTKNQ